MGRGPVKHLAYLFGGAAALGAASYLVIYLYRWQWQRAILCGVLLLVVEVLLLGVAALARLSRLERRLMDEDQRQQHLLSRLRQDHDQPSGRGVFGSDTPTESGRPSPPRFRWLEESSDLGTHRTHVFVPVLMVTGVVLSSLAWVVQRIAEATVRPTAERRLAGRLTMLAAPPPVPTTGREADLVADGGVPGGPTASGTATAPGGGGGSGAEAPELEDLPLFGDQRPGGGKVRRGRWVTATGVVIGLVALGGLVVALASATETRPESAKSAAATSLVIHTNTRGHLSPERIDLATRQVWERCRDSTSVPLDHTALSGLDEHLYAAVARPALGDHDRMRLKGCLEDAILDRVQLSVVGVNDTPGDN